LHHARLRAGRSRKEAYATTWRQERQQARRIAQEELAGWSAQGERFAKESWSAEDHAQEHQGGARRRAQIERTGRIAKAGIAQDHFAPAQCCAAAHRNPES